MSSAPNYFPPPSGPLANLTRSVATLRLDPATLAERLGLRFLPGFDDLDFLDWAEVIGRLGRYALVYHRNAPNPSTELVISSESRNPRLELTDALDALRLTEKDVSWMHPDVVSEPRRQRAFVKAKRRVAARAVPTKRRSPARTASARSNRSTRKK